MESSAPWHSQSHSGADNRFIQLVRAKLRTQAGPTPRLATDSDLKEVTRELLVESCSSTDPAIHLQIRAWILYSVADCSGSTKRATLCLGSLQPLRQHIYTQGSGRALQRTALATILQNGNHNSQTLVLRHLDPDLCPLGALGLHIWTISKTPTSLFYVEQPFDAGFQLFPSPTEDARSPLTVHNALGRLALCACWRVGLADKIGDTLHQVVDSVRGQRLDEAGVPSEARARHWGRQDSETKAAASQVLLAQAGWVGEHAQGQGPPRFRIRVSEQLLDMLLSGCPDLQSDSAALAPGAPLRQPLRTCRLLVRFAVQDMVQLVESDDRYSFLAGHPFSRALEQAKAWHELKASYGQAKAEHLQAAASDLQPPAAQSAAEPADEPAPSAQMRAAAMPEAPEQEAPEQSARIEKAQRKGRPAAIQQRLAAPQAKWGITQEGLTSIQAQIQACHTACVDGLSAMQQALQRIAKPAATQQKIAAPQAELIRVQAQIQACQAACNDGVSAMQQALPKALAKLKGADQRHAACKRRLEDTVGVQPR